MKNIKENVEVAEATTTTTIATVVEPVAKELLGKSKYADSYLGQGYELSDFLTRSREAAKAECNNRRAAGKQAAYVGLKDGFYGLFEREAPAKETKAAAKPTRSYPEVAFTTPDGSPFTFESSKAARAYASLLIEAARQAEFDADREAALAAKSTQA